MGSMASKRVFTALKALKMAFHGAKNCFPNPPIFNKCFVCLTKMGSKIQFSFASPPACNEGRRVLPPYASSMHEGAKGSLGDLLILKGKKAENRQYSVFGPRRSPQLKVFGGDAGGLHQRRARALNFGIRGCKHPTRGTFPELPRGLRRSSSRSSPRGARNHSGRCTA